MGTAPNLFESGRPRASFFDRDEPLRSIDGHHLPVAQARHDAADRHPEGFLISNVATTGPQ
jgi:hypothetical protein